MGRLVKKACCVATLVMSSYCAAADQADAKDSAFFEERVAPILCGHCASCTMSRFKRATCRSHPEGGAGWWRAAAGGRAL
jgi:hypothetical protein